MAASRQDFKHRIDVALGHMPADLVIKNVRLFNVIDGSLTRSDIAIAGDRIVGMLDNDYRGVVEIDGRDQIAVPGFIDTHVHPESTLVLPGEFDRLLLGRGTTTAIADPHEITNVLGTAGIKFYADSAKAMAMDLRVNLSSCVPASPLETSGAELSAQDLASLRGLPHVLGLAEFMNFPGLLNQVDSVLDKLVAFQDDLIDGHAPLLSGRSLNAYLSCGIRNCHESTGLVEAHEKLLKGMQVLIRDGSVTRDVHALAKLIDITHSPFVSFCTDDRTPLHIAEDGHLDHLIRTSIRLGRDPLAVYRAATWSAANAFGLKDRGLIAPGKLADIVLIGDLAACDVQTVIRAGKIVDDSLFEGRRLPPAVGYHSIQRTKVSAALFETPCLGPTGPVIGIRENQIVTDALTLTLPYRQGRREADVDQDVAKVAVLERHGRNNNVGRGFVKGLGLNSGAIASSVGHDAHNIIVAGQNDEDMALAVNRLIELQGGFVAAKDGSVLADLALPVAGLMSDQSAAHVEEKLRHLRAALAGLGCRLAEPFVQMAFLPLSVIPHLKITDFGLIDVDRFAVIGLDG